MKILFGLLFFFSISVFARPEWLTRPLSLNCRAPQKCSFNLRPHVHDTHYGQDELYYSLVDSEIAFKWDSRGWGLNIPTKKTGKYYMKFEVCNPEDQCDENEMTLEIR